MGERSGVGASADVAGAASQRAAAFAIANGSPLSAARARALTGAAPTREVLAALEAREASTAPDALLDTLAILGEQRALRSSLAESVCAAAVASQEADGGFGPGSGSTDARLSRTGMLGGYLARSPFARPEALDAAGDFLARSFQPERLQSFQWQNIAGYAHYFANAPHDASDEILQWCGRELERGFRARAFDAVRTARVLVLCDAHAVPGAQLEASELVVALVTEQAVDGGFGDGDREERVEETLAGLAALRFLTGGSGLDTARGPR